MVAPDLWGDCGMLLDNEAVGAKVANHHVDAVPRLHIPAFIRERHPIRLARLGCTALAQFSHLLHGRNYQFDARPRVDQGGLVLFIVECCGFLRVKHSVAKPNDLSRLHRPDGERINAPNQRIIRKRFLGDRMWAIAVWNHSRRRLPCRRRGLIGGLRGWRLSVAKGEVTEENRDQQYPLGALYHSFKHHDNDPHLRLVLPCISCYGSVLTSMCSARSIAGTEVTKRTLPTCRPSEARCKP